MPSSLLISLKQRLADPTVASKEWIIRQYDHEVQGRSVIKPLVGVRQEGPGDAAVLRPRLDSRRGAAIGCGLCPQLADIDPYWMAVAAIDEAIRNVVCVGGDPARTAILDNFCWGRTDEPETLGALVRACQGCYDAAKAYGVPFISGKDSLNNEFALHADDVARVSDAFRLLDPGAAGDSVHDGRLRIPGTLLISALAIVEDVATCITMDLKLQPSRLYVMGSQAVFGDDATEPAFDCRLAARVHATAARLIRDGGVLAAHDVSDGGLLTACAEMAMAGDVSCWLGCGPGHETRRFDWFREWPSLYVLQIPERNVEDFERAAADVPLAPIGQVDAAGGAPLLTLEDRSAGTRETVCVAELRECWQAPLRW